MARGGHVLPVLISRLLSIASPLSRLWVKHHLSSCFTWRGTNQSSCACPALFSVRGEDTQNSVFYQGSKLGVHESWGQIRGKDLPLTQPCLVLKSPTESPVSLAVECTLGQSCGILVDLRSLLGLISAASSEVLPACPGMETAVPLQASRSTATLWGWGSWLVYAGSCCTTSEQLKIAASIAMATGAASLSYEGAAWMLPWWIPGKGGRVGTMGAPSLLLSVLWDAQ